MTSSTKRIVPASRNVVVPDFSISTDANWADSRSSSAVYTEYNVGHYSRSFTLSNEIDHKNINAVMHDGMLTLTLHKVKETQPKRIAVQ